VHHNGALVHHTQLIRRVSSIDLKAYILKFFLSSLIPQRKLLVPQSYSTHIYYVVQIPHRLYTLCTHHKIDTVLLHTKTTERCSNLLLTCLYASALTIPSQQTTHVVLSV
jgi:hypothetical protein